MTWNQFVQWSMNGIDHFIWTFRFFYSHLALVVISLIPSIFRALQLWRQMQAPVWMEIVVESTRIVLLFLIITMMAKVETKQLFQARFWHELKEHCSVYLSQNWPHVVVPQIIAFVLLMYFLMNMLIFLVVSERTVQAIMGLFNIQDYNYNSASNAIQFFIKNMSIIPMAMVYWIGMFGVRFFTKS